MQNNSKKLATLLIAAFLVLSIAGSTILTASAHTPEWTVITTAHVAAAPDNIGVGQKVMIYSWLDKIFDGALPSGNAAANEYRFHNYTLVITKPDNTTDKLYQDRIEDTTSNQMFSYTPTQVGTYTIQFFFPGMKYNTGTAGIDYSATSQYVNDTYRASNATTTFTVQEEPIQSVIDSYPLPAEYWTRPIYGENTIWFQVASNWLGVQAAGYGGFANSYNTGGNGQFFGPTDAVGPLTGHIMWTKPLQSGGVVGSGTGLSIIGDTYFEGSAYIQRYTNPIIVNGKIYFSEPKSFSSGSGYMTTCVDLRTGEEIWSIPAATLPQPAFAYIYDVQDYNQHGVFNAILFTSNFARAFDADTGEQLFNVTSVPSATAWAKVRGPSGEELRYVFTNQGTTSNPNWTLGQWNSSKLWLYNGNTPAIDTTTTTTYALANTTYYENNVKLIRADNITTTVTQVLANITSGLSNRYDWLTTVGWRNNMTSTPTIVYSIYDDMMLLQNGSLPSNAPSAFMGTLGFNPYSYVAINLNASRPGYKVGDILWTKTFDPPAGNLTVLLAGVDPVNRVFVENLRETTQFKGYSLDDGHYMWTTNGQEPLDYYGSPASGSISNTFAYGNLYSSAYGGVVYCYDTKTGQVEWTYGNGGQGNNTDSGLEVPGPYPTFINAIGNDVVYLVTSEHTIETPLFKGALSRAINATTGAEIWTLNSYVGEFSANSYAIADGYATWFNGLDNQIYSVGRGPSSLTVSAPQTGITFGNSLIISGTVMDVSAGTQQNEQAVRFANGVPVSSDASMKDWMGYVYQQKPLPTNFTGVEVTVSVIDANGNYRVIGTTSTDIYGKYNLQWTPDITGQFYVYSTFAGTQGYWPSSSSAAFAVDAAAATPTPVPTQEPSAADLYFIPATIGVIIAIVVVGAVIALLVSKKP
jgi:outer membrane protein assembly factor BamB